MEKTETNFGILSSMQINPHGLVTESDANETLDFKEMNESSKTSTVNIDNTISRARQTIYDFELEKLEQKEAKEILKTSSERILELEIEVGVKEDVISKLKSESVEFLEVKDWGSKMFILLSRMTDLHIQAGFDQIEEFQLTPITEPIGTTGINNLAGGRLFNLIPELEHMFTTYPDIIKPSRNRENGVKGESQSQTHGMSEKEKKN